MFWYGMFLFLLSLKIFLIFQDFLFESQII